MKRHATTTFGKCLAVHMAAADRRDHRQPRTVLARIGHLLIGVVLGATVAAIVIGWIAGHS